MRDVLQVGLIADTHGLLRPEAVTALAGVDHIVHAGDADRAEILDALRDIAPVTAVRGNVDRGAWAAQLPATAQVQLGGVWIHVLHIVEGLDLDPRAAGFDVVVYGHSHQPSLETRDGVLFVNPGSAGPRRFDLPVSVALLEIAGGKPRIELLTLDV